jgi:hypothetical protein
MIGYKFTDTTPPYKSKNITPLAKVDVVRTPYTVPSLGLNISRYILTNNSVPDFSGTSNLTLVDNGTSPLVGFFYGGGAPPGFSTVNRFAYKYTGYFYALYPSNRTSGYGSLPWNFNKAGSTPFTFSVAGYGHIRVKIEGTYIIGSGGYEELSPTAYVQGSKNLNPGQWYAIEILYYSDTDESGLAVLWKNGFFWGDNSDTYNYGLPVSAGVTSTTNSFLTATTLSGVEKVQVSQAIGEASTLQFDLPLDNTNGYYYDRVNDKYIYNPDTTVQLKSRWLVEGYIGFVNLSSVDEYVKKFTGVITEISPKRNSKDKDTITVKCRGFEEFLSTALNLNYPDKFDYWAAGYAGSEYGFDHPDGVDMPPTYDGWELTKVVQSLMTRAYIDPSLFIEKKTYVNNAGDSVAGNFLMERSSPEFVILDKGRNYGEPFATVEDDQVIDTSYVIQSNFGETITDYINKVVDIYGWEWGFSDYHNGAPFLKPKNNPIQTKFVSDATFSGNWSDIQYDIDAVNGEYKDTTSNGAYAQFSFRGKRIELVLAMADSILSSGAATRVTAGSTTSAVKVNSTSGFSAGNILVIQFDDTHEYSTISSTSGGDTINVSPPLEKIPIAGAFAKTASYSAEVRRGTSWGSGVSVLTTYQSGFWDSDDFQSTERVGWNQYRDPIGPLDFNRRLYYQGIDPRIARNPCKHLIASGLSYDDYLVRVTGLGGRVGVNALFVYSDDPLTPVDTFRTGNDVEVGTVVELGLDDAIQDQRNDTIVVGRRLGAEVAGIEDRTVNPNNPYYRHILSRAMDIGSIYDSDTQNFVGRPLQTIQIAPELSSQSRVDHWAVAFINRYRFPGRFPSYGCITNPLIEPGDCISIDDEGKSLVKYFDRAWVESINTAVSKTSIVDKIKTTTYAPWESFVPRKQFDSLANFGNLAIQNLNIKESATGETITTINPYDPYSSQENNNLVEITYDLNISGNVRIDVYNAANIRVATLLNVATESEDLGWLHQDIGKNYKVIWDGVDMFGDHNKFAGLSQVVADPKKFYVAERSGVEYETFYIKFTIKQNNGKLHFITSRDDFLDPNQFIYTKRGNPVQLDDTKTFVVPKFIPEFSVDAVRFPITYTNPTEFGFFSNSAVDAHDNPTGLAIYFGVSDNNNKPVIAFVDITTYLIGVSEIKLKPGTGTGKGIKTFSKMYLAEIKEPTLRISTTFKDFTKPYKLNFNPLNFGYPFWHAGEGYYSIDELRIDGGVHGDTDYANFEARSYGNGWYFRIVITIFDASGRSDTRTFYTRWCGEDSTDDIYKRFITPDDIAVGLSSGVNLAGVQNSWAISNTFGWNDDDEVGFIGGTSRNVFGLVDPRFRIRMNYKFPG